MPATVRISPAAHQSLRQMAEDTSSSLQEILDQAIENQRRRLLLERANRAYAELRHDKKAWRAWRSELRELDATLTDAV